MKQESIMEIVIKDNKSFNYKKKSQKAPFLKINKYQLNIYDLLNNNIKI